MSSKDVTSYTKASLPSEIGKKTEVFSRISTVSGESETAIVAGADRKSHGRDLYGEYVLNKNKNY